MSHLFPMTLPHVKHLTGMIMAPRDCACPFLSLFRESRHDDRSPLLSPSAPTRCEALRNKRNLPQTGQISGAAPVWAGGGRRGGGSRLRELVARLRPPSRLSSPPKLAAPSWKMESTASEMLPLPKRLGGSPRCTGKVSQSERERESAREKGEESSCPRAQSGDVQSLRTD